VIPEKARASCSAVGRGGGGGSGLLHGEFAAVGDGSWMRSSWMGFMAVMTTIWNNYLSIFIRKKPTRFFPFYDFIGFYYIASDFVIGSHIIHTPFLKFILSSEFVNILTSSSFKKAQIISSRESVAYRMMFK
jgi:hypothetical protein